MAVQSSMKISLRFALVAVLAVSSLSVCYAQEDEDEVEAPLNGYFHPLTNMPEEAEDVQTYFAFPNREQVDGMYQMASGEKVNVVVGFHNDGETPINVTGVMASLNNPVDFRMHIQNFTYLKVDTAVQAGQELSVSYFFQPDAALSPREFVVAITAFYEADGEMFSSTFFNSTVNIIDPSGNFDSQTFFMYFFILAFVGGLVSTFYKQIAGAIGLKKSSSKGRVLDVAPTDGDDNEWLKGTFVPGSSNPRKVVKRSTKSKK